MIRGRRSLGRIGRLLACALAALAATIPATAGAQSPAVDEYTLDIPGGGGSQSGDPGSPPPTGAEASGARGGGGAAGDGSAQGGGGEGTAGQGQRGSGEGVRYDNFHEDGGASASGTGSGTSQPLDTSSRSAPEVVADSLTDDGMLPLIAALVLITGVGAWRVLRHRRTLTRAPG
jgi:hypothetical protein